ncbi:hypothetical protein [Inquilinus sp.]|jgi:hypothetical protein|uniref:secretion/conjugation apparatus DotM-related subunit n=1 Tax=Inquilinus sp. TaxID=1932117 RepID=UPI0037837177
MERRRKQFLQTPPGLMIVFAGTIYALVGILWFTRPDMMGTAFHRLRMIESLGTWPLWSGGWARVFERAGLYRPGMSAMATASIPFGIICALLIVAIGTMALVRVRMDHVDSLAAAPRPRKWREVMAAQSQRYPANRFFLDYDLVAMPLDEGPARMPEKALELLERVAAIEDLLDPPVGEVAVGVHAGPDLVVREDPVSLELAGALGGPNPFLAPVDVAAAVEELPWWAAILLHAALERIVARDGDGRAEAFAASVAGVARRMDDVWRHLNTLKAKHGDRLVLGRKGAKEGTLTLAEALEEDNPAAPDRVWLMDAIGRDHPELLGLLHRNQHLCGCLATVLAETRSAGIFPPESFRWLRFVDYRAWCFLRSVGAPTCPPIAAGAQAHWQAERVAGRPLEELQFKEAFRALRVEARKYLTPEAMRRLRAGRGGEVPA